MMYPRRQRTAQPRSSALGRLLIGFGLLMELTAIAIEVFTP